VGGAVGEIEEYACGERGKDEEKEQRGEKLHW
jgi:hypothetical protein